MFLRISNQYKYRWKTENAAMKRSSDKQILSSSVVHHPVHHESTEVHFFPQQPAQL